LSRISLSILCAAAGFAVGVSGAGAAEAESAAADTSVIFRSYRTYAREDTLEVPLTYIYGEYVEVEARRVSLDEIIRRCIAAEKTKYDGVEDIQFTISEKTVLHYGDVDDADARRTVHESVSRIYRKRPDFFKEVELSSREYTIERSSGGELVRTDEESEAAVKVRSAREELVDLPFFFEDLSDYRFNIVERRDLEDRVLYRIRFKPRSDFKPLPTGEFWVDTTDFQIFHTDMRFTENVPVPLILKAVDHVSIQMRRLDDRWVWDRLTARVTLRKIPLIKIPRVAEIVVEFDDYAVNQGIVADIFEGSGR
jgi:hypothetical protein